VWWGDIMMVLVVIRFRHLKPGWFKCRVLGKYGAEVSHEGGSSL